MKINLIKKLKYLYYRNKVNILHNKIKPYYDCTLNKEHKITLYYMASKDLDYAFYKVYNFWGMDGLTENEKNSF